MRHSKFFQNKKCEYFPCHAGIKEEEFNCLFCFCPWYWHCGSKGELLDCSECRVPHFKNSWKMIMQGIEGIRHGEASKTDK